MDSPTSSNNDLLQELEIKIQLFLLEQHKNREFDPDDEDYVVLLPRR